MASVDHKTRGSHSIRVVEHVARREGVSPDEIDQPLHDAVDPDALDALFRPKPTGEPRDVAAVVFEYYGYTVVVRPDTGIELLET